MPAPHRLASLAAGGDVGRALAVAELRSVLSALNWNVTAAARTLGVHRVTLSGWITTWGLRAESTETPKKDH